MLGLSRAQPVQKSSLIRRVRLLLQVDFPPHHQTVKSKSFLQPVW
jgi:hypothetical protein